VRSVVGALHVQGAASQETSLAKSASGDLLGEYRALQDAVDDQRKAALRAEIEWRRLNL